jgi:murein DD-endopeptidase MepM/ murein hydrolase activator NlpD
MGVRGGRPPRYRYRRPCVARKTGRREARRLEGSSTENRCLYHWENPLEFTDPSGLEPHTAATMAVYESPLDVDDYNEARTTAARMEAVSDAIENIERENALVQAATVSPIAGGVLASPYGTRESPITGGIAFHTGIDLAGVPSGTPVNATGSGVVGAIGYSDAVWGNWVAVNFGNDIISISAHLRDNSITVSLGENVGAGLKMAGVGNTGWSTRPHVHFSFRTDGVLSPVGMREVNTVNPSIYLPSPTIRVTGPMKIK